MRAAKAIYKIKVILIESFATNVDICDMVYLCDIQSGELGGRVVIVPKHENIRVSSSSHSMGTSMC
jgi:hypothetical protein